MNELKMHASNNSLRFQNCANDNIFLAIWREKTGKSGHMTVVR